MGRFRLLPRILFAFFAITTSAHAASRGGHGGWYLQLEPFWLKTQDDWSRHSFIAPVFNNNNADTRLNSTWAFGGHIALGYDASSCSPCYYWGASAEYMHFNSNEHATAPENNLFTSSFSPLDFGLFNAAKAELTTRYDVIDILAHYHNTTWGYFTPDLFGGFRYARIDERIQADYSFEESPASFGSLSSSLSSCLERRFRGVGPEVGLGVTFPIYRCIGLNGQLSGAYLCGHRRHQDLFNLTTSTDGINFPYSVDNRNCEHRWIPAVAARLSLGYQVTYCNCSTLRLEAGYRYDRYFDPLITNTSPCNACGGSNHSQQDFTFQGPFAMLTWHL